MHNILGKNLIIIGLIIAAIGAVIYFKDSVSVFRFLGKLPGDIVVKKENFSFYFPLATSIIISIILSFLIFIFNKLR
ncbi:MAG: DUF2905 domain-containing protein [Spirochaetes bacterium]|nr:DUF2905 domain-containing protein [Spirochaetota bacterium]